MSDEVADALLGAEEILEVLSLRGTRGVERECSAGRIADVLARVRAAKRLVGSPAVSGSGGRLKP